jgi:hypothetical protein
MLRLKENPREWQKFVAVIGLAASAMAWLSWWRGKIPLVVPVMVASIAAAALLTALIQPRWFRGIYRSGMTVSFHIGQTIGKVMLTAFFFLVVTPLSLLLRMCGKDLLEMKPDPADKTWWRPAKNNRDFDRMF